MRGVLIFLLVVAVFTYTVMQVEAGKGSCSKCKSHIHAETDFCKDCRGEDVPVTTESEIPDVEPTTAWR